MPVNGHHPLGSRRKRLRVPGAMREEGKEGFILSEGGTIRETVL